MRWTLQIPSRIAGALRRGTPAWACALVLVLLIPLTVRAAWTPVDATETSYDYLDPSTVRVDGGLRRVWTLHDLAQTDADGDRSYRSLLEFHCPESRYRSLQTLFFAGAMATGRMTGRTAQPGAWRSVQAASVAATVMQRVCAVR